ncbi:MAG TPA: FtsQ-type POTRA domain-containing protein [Polyangiaceae bacterium]
MKAPRPSVHGATVSAPPELFDISDSPTPAGVVTNKKRTNRPAKGKRPADGEPGFVSKLAAGLRLVAGLTIVVGASAAVAWSVHRYAMTTPRFGIRTLTLTGNSRLTQADVVEQGGIEMGKNLFSFDTRAAQEKLVKNPWVASAKVTRELPNTLEVELVERKPAALAALGERLFLVTKEGEPFKEVQPEDPTDFPVVTGITAAELGRDRSGALERIRTAVGVLDKYQGLKLAHVYPAEELHLEPSGHAVLTIGKQGITLALGLPPYARKLAMAAEVMGELRAKNRVPGMVFLDNDAHPERVVVRMK